MAVDKSEKRIREMFGAISPRYDFLNHFLSAGTDIYWRWRTVRSVPLQEDVPILDVCSGTGDLAIAYWKRGRGRIPVVGSDFAHDMLRLANGKSARISQKNPLDAAPMSFLEADTQRLPFTDETFQIVSVAFGLRNVTNTETGLREMIRVCRPGGHVVVLEFTMPTNWLLGRLYRFYFRYILPRIGQLLARNSQSAYNYLPESVSQFPQGNALTSIMADCGLDEVRWKSLTFGVAAIYVGMKPNQPESDQTFQQPAAANLSV
jgi:demethylmenaquinone methyltransferase/2-methoxy-6-polyprenyl-1,4-benzoquinol methylase